MLANPRSRANRLKEAREAREARENREASETNQKRTIMWHEGVNAIHVLKKLGPGTYMAEIASVPENTQVSVVSPVRFSHTVQIQDYTVILEFNGVTDPPLYVPLTVTLNSQQTSHMIFLFPSTVQEQGTNIECPATPTTVAPPVPLA
jgi:hypothetical protein